MGDWGLDTYRGQADGATGGRGTNTDSLALRPAALPSRNLQHAIACGLLRSATGVNEQFPGRDLNPLDGLPMTACDLTPSTST
jgi:hypothetical protein